MQELVDIGETLIFILMLLASILAVAVVLERWVVFKKNTAKTQDDLVLEAQTAMRNHDSKKTKEILESYPDSVYKRFLNFSMEQVDKHHPGIQELMEGKIISEKIELEKRLPILNTLGNNAPFLGLLGTVLGVIKAFYGLGTLGNTGAEVVMRSISTALLATAAGLGVAIPVVMANNYFSRKLKVILQTLDILTKEVLGNFTHKTKNHNHS
jgi:biopolymer transport protein ExbB